MGRLSLITACAAGALVAPVAADNVLRLPVKRHVKNAHEEAALKEKIVDFLKAAHLVARSWTKF
jgi:hypothetical protein